MPSLKNAQKRRVRKNDEKTEIFAKHLSTVFKRNDIQSLVHKKSLYLPETTIKLIFLMEVTQEIDAKISAKKANAIDKISPGLSRELSR